MIPATLLVLAGCASPAAHMELQEAEANLRKHDTAPIFFNVDLPSRQLGDSAPQERAPEVQARLARASGCGDRFREAFVATLNAASNRGADGLSYALGQAPQLDGEFARCIEPFGLVGYPEFQVGDTFVRTDEFLRSYWTAGMRHASAQQQVDRESSDFGMALAVGLGAGGRAAANATASPVVVPATTVTRPIRCTSYKYGLYVDTSCQ